MKAFKRVFSIFMALILLLLPLAACDTPNAGDDTTVNDETTTPQSDNPAPKDQGYSIQMINDKCYIVFNDATAYTDILEQRIESGTCIYSGPPEFSSWSDLQKVMDTISQDFGVMYFVEGNVQSLKTENKLEIFNLNDLYVPILLDNMEEYGDPVIYWYGEYYGKQYKLSFEDDAVALVTYILMTQTMFEEKYLGWIQISNDEDVSNVTQNSRGEVFNLKNGTKKIRYSLEKGDKKCFVIENYSKTGEFVRLSCLYQERDAYYEVDLDLFGVSEPLTEEFILGFGVEKFNSET